MKTWEYKLPFGKYKGSSIKEVYNKDKSYLKWMYNNNVITFSPELRGIIKEIKLHNLLPHHTELPHWAEEVGYYI